MSNNSAITYKRLKLDKFVSGSEQRIFKTTTESCSSVINSLSTDDSIKFYSFEPTNFKYKQKDIYYAEFNSLRIANALLENQNILSSNLINFHDINADYMSNRPDKSNILTFNR